MTRNFKINPKAALEVKARSKGKCEACGFFEAVHLHHLTYARAGKESARDLLHICTFCHCAAHPEKYDKILEWEANRRVQVKKVVRLQKASLQSEAEREREYEDRQQERERERDREEEHRRKEPAWNLGQYVASGYDYEAVVQEDGFVD